MHNSISPAVRSDDSNRSLSRHTHPTGFLNLFPTGCSCNLDPNKPLKPHEPEPFQPTKPPHPTHSSTLSMMVCFVLCETTDINESFFCAVSRLFINIYDFLYFSAGQFITSSSGRDVTIRTCDKFTESVIGWVLF